LVLDHVDQRRGLAGAGRTPQERELAIGAQRNRRALARVERGVIAAQLAVRTAAVRPLAEQRERQADRVALDRDLAEHLDQPVVEKPRRDHERERPRRRIDRLFGGERDPRVVAALDRDPDLAARGAQRALAAGGEPIAGLGELEAVALLAEVLSTGQRDLERLGRRPQRRDLALDGALERGHELRQELRVRHGLPTVRDAIEAVDRARSKAVEGIGTAADRTARRGALRGNRRLGSADRPRGSYRARGNPRPGPTSP
jgi:hypothetical protein